MTAATLLAEQALQGLDPLSSDDAQLLFVAGNAQLGQRRWEAALTYYLGGYELLAFRHASASYQQNGRPRFQELALQHALAAEQAAAAPRGIFGRLFGRR